jgi:hypothetical protein
MRGEAQGPMDVYHPWFQSKQLKYKGMTNEKRNRSNAFILDAASSKQIQSDESEKMDIHSSDIVKPTK